MTRYQNYLNQIDYLVLLRLGASIYCIVFMVTLIPDFHYVFGYKALYPNDVSMLTQSYYEFSLYKISELTGIAGTSFYTLFFLLYFSSAILLLLGFNSRISALVLLLLYVLMLNNTPAFNYGVDAIVVSMLFYNVILPTSRRLSLDSRGRSDEIKENKYFRYLIQSQLSFGYFFAGLAKLVGENWRNGESVWKVMHIPHFHRDEFLNYTALIDYDYIFVILGWATILLEMMYFIINIEALRSYMLIAIVLLHVYIAYDLSLYYFSAVMILINCVAYYNFPADKKVSPF